MTPTLNQADLFIAKADARGLSIGRAYNRFIPTHQQVIRRIGRIKIYEFPDRSKLLFDPRTGEIRTMEFTHDPDQNPSVSGPRAG